MNDQTLKEIRLWVKWMGKLWWLKVRNEVASIIYRYSKDGIISNNAEIFNQSPFQNGLMPKLSITNWRIERLRAILYPFIRHSRFKFTAKAAIDLVISHVDCVGGQKKSFHECFVIRLSSVEKESSIISPRFIITHPLTTLDSLSFVIFSRAHLPSSNRVPRAPIVPPF